MKIKVRADIRRYSLLILLIVIFASFFGIARYLEYYNDFFRVHNKLPYIARSEFTITERKQINDYESLTILHFKNQISLLEFIDRLESDVLTKRHVVENGDAQNLRWMRDDNKPSYLPFSLSCDCYSYYTFNLESEDGGYLYQILIYENYVIIDIYTK